MKMTKMRALVVGCSGVAVEAVPKHILLQYKIVSCMIY